MALDSPGGADIIFFGGEIVTVAPGDTPEAVAVKDGRIAFAGDYAEALAGWQGTGTVLRDLDGQALLPGFIDAHGHLVGIGLQATIASLLAEPDGDVDGIPAVQDKLREFAESPAGQRSEWIMGFGYDDSLLGGHPTREDLDKVSMDRPVLAIHQSFHLGVVNGKGLEVLGYGAATPDPPGGVIRRQSPLVQPYGEPNGVLEETAFNPAAELAIAGLHPEDSSQLLARGLKSAASFGFTTVQEGNAPLDILETLRAGAQQSPDGLPLDVVVYVKAADAVAEPDRVCASRAYAGGLRAGGMKMVLDGSPQGRTAWLRHPYTTPPDGLGTDYRGYATLEDATVVAQLRAAFSNRWQVIAHVNGDAAIDQLIDAAREVTKAAAPADRRTVAIHAQTAREDQIDAFRELGVIPSFFSMHTFYWGDWYRETVLGPERAQNISPARWAVDRQMIYTSHHDAPVALPDSIAILSSQVTRVTRTGSILGPDQRVSALDAVKSLTLHAAYQYFEEADKGSIEAGKLADLVILSDSPLTVRPEAIKDITVRETIKAGRTIYARETPERAAPRDPGAVRTAPISPAAHC